MKIKTGVILAAGKGERLDSQNSIKPLVHVGHKPLIIWNIELMQDIGIEKIYIVLGYKGELIKKELMANPLIKAKIIFIENYEWQNGMLDSILSIDNVEESFFLSPCDLFFENNPYKYFNGGDIKFEGLVSLVYSLQEQGDFTGAQSKITVREDGSISFLEPQTIYNGVETGIYYFGENLLHKARKIVKEQSDIKTLPQLLEHLSNKGLLRVRLFQHQMWFDVNTPSVRIRAEMFLRNQPNYKLKTPRLEKHLTKVGPFTAFATKKEVETEIYVKQNCLKEIDTFELIPEHHADSPHFLLTDVNVNKLFGEDVYRKLKSCGYNITKIVLPCGEESKTIQNYIYLSERILSEGIDERSILISLGGGTINNVTGFLASTLYRGIYLIHIPTTLMAQCDAAIGVKQAVNGDKGKNLVGSYYEPLKIIVDPSVLITSEERWLKDGLAECIKHAIAQDPDFYNYLLHYNGKIKDVDFLEYSVKRNIELKTRLMEVDPKEKAEALVLQYGHTIGHAVEYLSGYKLGHGEAVAIGMVAAAKISNILDIAEYELVEAHCNIIKKFGLPITINSNIRIEDIITALRYNKRYLYGDIQFVLLDEIGSLWNYNGDYSVPCDNDILTKALSKCYGREKNA